VSNEYNSPFPFTGTLHSAAYEVSGEHVVNLEAEFGTALARQ